MQIPFSKYEGCGNDFILIDNRTVFFPIEADLITKLCHRRLGIGADGIILLENSSIADYRMRIFNADGSEAEMCGNGFRCFGKFLHEIGIQNESFNIEVFGKILSLKVEEGQITAGMSQPTDICWNIQLEIGGKDWVLDYLDTGVPHAVLFVDDVEKINLQLLGKEIRFHSKFAPRGTNVNFAQLNTNGEIWMRTYERGVEDETLACGTGATAVAIAASKKQNLKGPRAIKTRSGGILNIDFKWEQEDVKMVTMSGPATFVFRGTIELPEL